MALIDALQAQVSELTKKLPPQQLSDSPAPQQTPARPKSSATSGAEAANGTIITATRTPRPAGSMKCPACGCCRYDGVTQCFRWCKGRKRDPSWARGHRGTARRQQTVVRRL